MRWITVFVLVACGGTSETSENEVETTSGSTVVTDEAWEQSAWEPEPVVEDEPEDTWTFERWREVLTALATDQRCEGAETFASVSGSVEAYAAATELEAVMTAHEALGRNLEEWRLECGSNVGRESVAEEVEHLTEQLERITASALEQVE